MACQKSHHLPCDYSLFLPALILTTAVLSCLPGAPSAPGSRLPGGIRSSGPTPTGSCWRTCQSPPNPLARFRAVATVRCVKTPGLQRPFRSRRGLRSLHPGKRPPGCKGQLRFANRASRRCGGSLPVVVSGAIHLFKPLSPGAKTATTVSASPGVKCTSRKSFCPKAGKNFCGLPPDSRFRPWQ